MTRLIALLLIPAFASCSSHIFPQQTTYAYVGKVRTGQPSQVDTFTTKRHETTVPLKFSGGQWHHNSAICFHHAKAEVHESEIHLTVFTALCPQTPSPVTPAFSVMNLTRPSYDLIFIDPDGTRHPIGKLRP